MVPCTWNWRLEMGGWEVKRDWDRSIMGGDLDGLREERCRSWIGRKFEGRMEEGYGRAGRWERGGGRIGYSRGRRWTVVSCTRN